MQSSCRYCGSKNIVNNGFRKTKQRGNVKIYKCKDCGRTFCEDDGFKWKHHSKDMILNAIELYVGGGVSLRFLAQLIRVSKNTILRWVLEYAGKIARFTNRLVPRIIQQVNIDELFLKMLGTFFYLWDSVCADTRFAFHFFSPTRKNKDAETLINQFKNALFMVFDGAFQYPSVLKKMFRVGGIITIHIGARTSKTKRTTIWPKDCKTL